MTDSPSKKFPKVFTFQNAEEAKAYIGCKVLFSNCLADAYERLPSSLNHKETLEAVNPEYTYPFTGKRSSWQFFTVYEEPDESDDYVPFGVEDAEFLVGKIVRYKGATSRLCLITSVVATPDASGSLSLMVAVHAEYISAQTLLKDWVFLEEELCGKKKVVI